MICPPCREQRHAECANPDCIRWDGVLTWYGNWCDCQHKPPGSAGTFTLTTEE